MKKILISLLVLAGVGCPVSRGADTQWEEAGNATFMDGWLLPAFGLDQTRESNWYEVRLQKAKGNENLYRLVDPYRSGPVAEYNQSTAEGYIEFDISDPKHVVVNWKLQQAGFSNSELGITELYCYNTLTYFGNYLYKGYTPQEIVDAVGNQMAYTTYEDGVVTLGKYQDPDPEFDYSYYDAKFGLQGNAAEGRNWTNALGKPSNMTTKIFLPETGGISDAVTAEDDARTVYYDLSGVRVENPVAGGIYIVKRGARTEKVIMR